MCSAWQLRGLIKEGGRVTCQGWAGSLQAEEIHEVCQVGLAPGSWGKARVESSPRLAVTAFQRIGDWQISCCQPHRQQLLPRHLPLLHTCRRCRCRRLLPLRRRLLHRRRLLTRRRSRLARRGGRLCSRRSRGRLSAGITAAAS